MTPPLEPLEGWDYRIIVADKYGNYEFDDIKIPQAAGEATIRLIVKLLEKTVKTKWERT